ncbi:MAG: DUF3276 family protein [Treponema sp.]|jgi:hypothetical protein|nr:DUF3276 family protein [Treponema sp.]
MGIRGEIFSTRMILPNRTYFLNVKENRLGDLYLNIVESKNKETGGFERQSVIVFADDLPAFLGEFDKSLKALEKAAREQKRNNPPSERRFKEAKRTSLNTSASGQARNGKRRFEESSKNDRNGDRQNGRHVRGRSEPGRPERGRPERGRPERGRTGQERPGGERRQSGDGGSNRKRVVVKRQGRDHRQ